MSGARLEKPGGVFAGIQYVEDFFRAENGAEAADHLPLLRESS